MRNSTKAAMDSSTSASPARLRPTSPSPPEFLASHHRLPGKLDCHHRSRFRRMMKYLVDGRHGPSPPPKTANTYSGGPEVSGHFQNHSQKQQKWTFLKIENKYFLMSITYHISQSSNISLGEVSSQVSTCELL